MKPEIKQLSAGLWLVATPIGTARDITLRALDVLASADVIAAEDTRTCRRLMDIHGIALNGRPLIAYHDHNGAQVRPRLIAMMQEGKAVAYASEAGTPLVADPGFALARAAIAEGLYVTTAPGPSAVIAALTIAGLPTDRFMFAGFPPVKVKERQAFFDEMKPVPATLVYYESPKRVHKMLDGLIESMGEDRRGAVCRELTKRFEEVVRGTLGEIRAAIAGRELKGEIVVLVDRGDELDGAPDMETVLIEALKTMSVKDAADAVATATGLPRRQVYQAALAMDRGK